MKNWFLAGLFILFLFACNKNGVKQVVIKDKYSMDVAAFMTESRELNEQASLQYMNKMRELYVIVLDEEKDMVHNAILINELEDEYSLDLEGYFGLINENYRNTFVIRKSSAVVQTRINGMAVKRVAYEIASDGNLLYFEFAFFEGRDYYFQVMVWTLQTKKNEHKPMIDKMIASFNEI